LAVAAPLHAAPPLPLDLIPEDACIGISIRDLAEVRVKGDKLFGKDERTRHMLRPSQLLDMAFKEVNLPWKHDEKKASAIICMTGPLAGFGADTDPNKDFTLGVVLGCRSREDVAKAYKIEVGDLKDGVVRRVPGKEVDRIFGTDQAGFRGEHVYLTGREKATAAWMKARTLRQGRTEAQQRRLDAADGLLYLGPPLLAVAQKDYDPEVVPDWATGPEAEAQKRLNRAWKEARDVLVGFRVNDGLGLDATVGFDPKGPNSQALLKSITGAGRTSDLSGLPNSDRLIGAFAAIGLERNDLHLARVLAADVWHGLQGPSGVLGSDAPVVRRIFGDLYSKLRLGRIALYQTSDPARFGQVAAVAVLEPLDTDKFMAEIGQYARLGDVGQFDPKAEASKAEIEKLIADLASEDFETREAATTKLALIGDPALPYLEKAAKAEDLEARRRANDLASTLRQAADLRKKELAEGLLKKAFRPTFTLKPKAETRADASVHLLGMRFDAEDAPYAAALKDLFGPEWSRLRIAVVNKKVVVLVGSDLALLDEAIRNVRDGKPGLEQSPALAEFHKHAAPGRRLELHLALDRVRVLIKSGDLPSDFKPSAAVSSLSLRSTATELGGDLWAPAETLADILTWLRL
jgi:hypothetical protein